MKELYVAVSGAISRERQLTSVANNLANVNTVGYKKDTAIFEVRPPEVNWNALENSADVELNLPRAMQREGDYRDYVRVADTFTDHSTGPMRNTERLMDVAIEKQNHEPGAAFFMVETSAGTRYTRMGNFQMNVDGELVTPDGYKVLDDGEQPIDVTGRDTRILQDGTVIVDNDERGQLGLRFFERPDLLDKTGHGLYSDRNGQVAGRDVEADDLVGVRQGFLEMSNVNPVDELVKMIECQRSYSAFQKTIQTMDDAQSQVIRAAQQ